MSSFTSELVLVVLPDGRRFKLYKPFVYHVGSRHSRKVISVPKDFNTDLASSPPPVWAIIPPFGKWSKPAVLHDFAYQVLSGQLPNPDYAKYRKWAGKNPRKWADNLFKESMCHFGCKQWQIFLMYWFVRIFGVFAYHSKE